jgi:biofilm PGA synthesis N-glycosyltransferase PgaC
MSELTNDSVVRLKRLRRDYCQDTGNGAQQDGVAALTAPSNNTRSIGAIDARHWRRTDSGVAYWPSEPTRSPRNSSMAYTRWTDRRTLINPSVEVQATTFQASSRHGDPAALRRECTEQGSITVVIPAHNEQASIGATLQSLRRQTKLPSSVVVVCDNCTDATAAVATMNRARVFHTVGNGARKAGALNQVLTKLLPTLKSNDLVLVMDADSLLSDNWLQAASDTLSRSSVVGAVCGVFLGEDGGRVIGQLQRNEYFRYARTVQRRSQAPVLSGTGTLFRVPALREIARERGGRLPGARGEFYSSASITEDDEITLALKTLGHRCVPVDGCHTTTEVMPTWLDLWRQRVRWQKGALVDLWAYGFTNVTLPYWLRQFGIYAGLILSVICWWIIIGSVTRNASVNILWTAAILGVNFTERLLTVRRAGPWGMLVSILMVPEFLYDIFRMCVFIRALTDALLGREIAWGHVSRPTVK